MPLLIEKTNNIYRKQPTQADFLRPTGVLADAVIVITAQHVATRIVETGFRYDTGDNQLEVHLNGQYLRTYEWIERKISIRGLTIRWHALPPRYLK